MQKIGFSFIFLFFSCVVCAQTVITGSVTTNLGKPIAGANITLTESVNNTILAYAITNDKGDYQFTFQVKQNTLQISARLLGYKKEQKLIENKTQKIDFFLQYEALKLQEIIVKSPPVVKRGDTINYNVLNFANSKDRTIGDVLAKMPGIEVLADGSVLYQGKAINKYYIEGLDLLEGKYGIANQNLPYGEVTKVQIIENHQPIKILDSLVFSDRAALNIKLKNSYTFTGQAKIGVGLAPLLWDNNLTPILLTKKQQMLSSYQANNVGENVASQLKKLTVEDLVDNFENNDIKRDWLAIQPLSTPNFSSRRWLDNNIHLLTTNYLIKLKKEYDLRLNASYINDYQQAEGSTKTMYFIPNSAIEVVESKYNQLYFNSLQTVLTLQKNTKSSYLKNKLEFEGFWDKQKGNITTNGIPLNQNLSNPYFKLNNKFKNVFSLGKQLITLTSSIGYNKMPQNLVIYPGQFKELLNNGAVFDKLTQNLNLTTFYTNNVVSLTKRLNYFTVTPKIAYAIEQQKLESEILTNTRKVVSNEFSNNLNWLNTKTSFDIQTQFNKDNLFVTLNSPISYQSYHLEDSPLKKTQQLKRIVFEPTLTAYYDLNTFWQINSSVATNKQFGQINQLHYGYLIQNYRQIQQIDTPLPESFSKTFNGGLKYRNTIKSLFANAYYTYSVSNNNLLYKNSILNNGANEISAVLEANKKYSQNVSARVSKYYSAIKTNITASSTYSSQKFNAQLNSNNAKVNNQNINFNIKINSDIVQWFGIEYQNSIFRARNKIQHTNQQNIASQSHQLNLNIYPNSKQYIGLNSELIINDSFSSHKENYFADFVYRYTWKKKNIDFEFQWNNILNKENHQFTTETSFGYTETNFKLRPSQVLFKIKFAL